MTRAEVPSGKTSQTLTESDAAGLVAQTLRPQHRVSDDRPRRRVDLPGERALVVEPLVAGQSPGQVAGAVDPGGGADIGDDVERHRGGQVERRVGHRRHGRQRHPPALVQVEVDLRPGRRTDEDVAAVLVGARTAQPVVEPAGQLGVEVDPGPRHRGGRVGVRPRAGQQAMRYAVPAELGDGAEGVVAVAVGPARDDHHRTLDPLVAPGRASQPHGSVVPVGAVTVLPQPGQHPRLAGLQAPQPLVVPPFAPDRRHGRQDAHRRHVVARSRRDRPAAARRRASGRRRSSGRPWRRSRRSPSAPAAARRRAGGS